MLVGVIDNQSHIRDPCTNLKIASRMVGAERNELSERAQRFLANEYGSIPITLDIVGFNKSHLNH